MRHFLAFYLPFLSQHISLLTAPTPAILRHGNFTKLVLSLLQSVGAWLSGTIYILFRPQILSAEALGNISKDFHFICYFILDYILKNVWCWQLGFDIENCSAVV